MAKEITISDIRRMFEKLRTASVTPDPRRFTKYKEGHVIDENQSVRWNREKVAAANEAYSAEALRLEAAWIEMSRAAHNTAISYLEQELHLGHDRCRIIWHRLYEDNHVYMRGLYNSLDDEIDYIKSILK